VAQHIAQQHRLDLGIGLVEAIELRKRERIAEDGGVRAHVGGTRTPIDRRTPCVTPPERIVLRGQAGIGFVSANCAGEGIRTDSPSLDCEAANASDYRGEFR